MFKKATVDPSKLISTFIGENTSLSGELKCDGNLRIDGAVEGQVVCTGHVIIGGKAVVKADIRARNVSVQGTVQGNIRGDRVEVLSGARVIGDVNATDLLLDEGGVVRGHVIMREEAARELPPLERADQA